MILKNIWRWMRRMHNPDNDYLPTRLAAVEKGWQDALARERRLEGIIIGILVQSGGRLTVTEDTIDRQRTHRLVMNDSSTLGEKAVRLELERAD